MLRLSKLILLLLFSSILFLLPGAAEASSGRIHGLSLNSNDYWIISDSISIFTNPAYINLYTQTLEVTAASRDGNPAPFSSLFARLDDRITLGVTLGYPHPSFYNLYCSGNPGDTYQDFNSNVDESGIPVAGDIQTNNIFLHLGYVLDNLKLGISASYTGLNTQDATEDLPPGETEVKTTSHRDFIINTGLLTEKTGPFDSIAVSFGAELPYLTREYSYTTQNSSDIKEVKGIGAWAYKLGFAGNILTSPDNQISIGVNYAAANFDCVSFEHLDNNNDGDFIDAGEKGVDDSLLAQRYSIKYGLADRLLFAEKGFVFFGVYSHIYKFKQYASGYNADGTKYDISINKSNRYTIPVIIGGEIYLTDWLTLRISGTKNIVFFTKWYDETTGKTFTDYTSAEGDSMINAGIGINFNNFSADLAFDIPWSGNSDPLVSDFNGYAATKLNLTWRF